MLYISELCEDCAVAIKIDYELDDAWTGIHDNGHVITAGKKLHGGSGRFRPPKCKKVRTLKNKKRAPKNCHRLQCKTKSLFNVADLVNGMWKVAPENENLSFGLDHGVWRLTLTVYWSILTNKRVRT